MHQTQQRSLQAVCAILYALVPALPLCDDGVVSGRRGFQLRGGGVQKKGSIDKTINQLL